MMGIKAAAAKNAWFYAGLERTARNDVYFAAFKNFRSEPTERARVAGAIWVKLDDRMCSPTP
jgi:hypothetical protein